MEKNNGQARQGDIFFKKVESPPKKGKKQLTNILAYGEVTGHTHKVVSPSISKCDSVVDENGDIYIKSKTEIVVDHDEHGTITLEPNVWFCISRQREYDPLAAEKERQVAD